MNQDDTINLLKECDEGAAMAMGSIEHIMSSVDNKELNSMLEDYKKAHQEIENKLDQLLSKLDEEGKQPGKMSKLFANLSTDMKLAVDNSLSEVAKILMDGCNMGIQSVSKYMNQYKEASGESQELAEKLVQVELRFMNDLRKYL